jgi:hypothetical protein
VAQLAATLKKVAEKVKMSVNYPKVKFNGVIAFLVNDSAHSDANPTVK